MAGFRFSMDRRGFAAARQRFSRAVENTQKRQLIAIQRAALMAEREMKKSLTRGRAGGQRFAPLSPITRLLRKGTKPLVDGGSLLGSISTTVDKSRKAAFIGVHRTAKAADGESLVNVAAAHEFGTKPFVIPVTDGVRKLFFFLHRASNGAIKPLSPTRTQILHPGIPARPFVRPTIEAIRPKLQKVIAKAFTERGGPI